MLDPLVNNSHLPGPQLPLEQPQAHAKELCDHVDGIDRDICHRSGICLARLCLAVCLPELPERHCRVADCDCAEAGTKLTEAALEQIAEELSKNVQPWKSGGFKFVKSLQDAPRSHGRVDMMQSARGAVAAKVMPNWWLKPGPAEFNSAYPQGVEHPWRDMAVLTTLNAMGFAYACDLLGVYRDATSTYFVSSLATEGDLFSWGNRAPPPGKEREVHIKDFMGQACSAVRLLHEIGIAHRDLSLENILLTDAGGGAMQVKIIDYSMVGVAQHGSGYKYGKSAYRSPEMYKKGDYDYFLSDAFALGVVLYAMAWQRYPWKTTQPGRDESFSHATKFGIASLDRQRSKESAAMMGAYSGVLYTMLEGLLAVKPAARMNLGESCYKPGASGNTVWDAQWL